MKIWLFLLIGLAINNALAGDIQSCRNERRTCEMRPCSMSLESVRRCRMACISSYNDCLKRIQHNAQSTLDSITAEIKNLESLL